MSYFFIFLASADDDAKKLRRLMEAWDDLYVSVEVVGNDPHRFNGFKRGVKPADLK